MTQRLGKASIQLSEAVYIINSASIVGKKEGEGPLGLLFDMAGEDDMFGCKTLEEAESSLQKQAVYLALAKSDADASQIRYLFAGVLLGQSIATSFGVSAYQIRLFGGYGACSTCGETLSLGTMSIAGGFAEAVICVTSSHNASAEKEFRFPLDYGNQRPLSATWTVTGSGAFVLGNEEALQRYIQQGKEKDKPVSRNARAKITGVTTGKIVDFGLKDSMNMGACMAPAAADTILQHFKDFTRRPEDYDKIITGELGTVGQRVLLDLLRDKGYDISSQHMDCGIEIYDAASQDTHAGGSGCGCSAVTLSAYILKQLEEHNWNRILFIPTGALLSKVSFNEGNSVPGIAHAVVLEAV